MLVVLTILLVFITATLLFPKQAAATAAIAAAAVLLAGAAVAGTVASAAAVPSTVNTTSVTVANNAIVGSAEQPRRGVPQQTAPHKHQPCDLSKIETHCPLTKPEDIWVDERYLSAIGATDAVRALVTTTGCRDEPTFWEMGRSAVVDGFNVRILPKGTRFYKGMPGFVIPSKFMEFVRSGGEDRPWWFGKSYFAMAFAQPAWGCLLAFITTRDLVMIDGFDHENVTRMAGLLKAAKMHRDLKRYREIKGVDEEAVAGQRCAMATKRAYIECSTIAPDELRHYQSCHVRTVQGVHPSGVKNYMTDIAIFANILNSFPAIDGWVHDHIRSTLEISGVFHFEELVIKGGSVLSGVVCNQDDPLDWSQWNLSIKLPPEGISIRTNPNNYTANDNFAQIKFILETRERMKQAPAPSTKRGIVSYNVHMFEAIESTVPPQASAIAEFLAKWSQMSLYFKKRCSLILGMRILLARPTARRPEPLR